MEYKGLTLDKFQQDAIHAIERNHSVVVSAPTGSGKTLIADYIIDRDVRNGVRVIYTAPIKALSNQKYKEFSRDYGEEQVGLLTGDVVKNPTAPILIMTTEIYRNMAIADDPLIEHVSYVVLDEIHYINDIERGTVWEESIIFSRAHVRFLCLSATIPNAEEFAAWIGAIKKHTVDVIRHDIRSVPLEVKFYDTELGVCDLKNIRDTAGIPDYKYVKGLQHQRRAKLPAPHHADLVKEIRGKTPCIFFNFSRAGCQQRAMELMKAHVYDINPKITTIVREKLDSVTPEIGLLYSTKILRQTLPYGIGFHHAGLLPMMKELIEDLFSKGMLHVLYTTETFAVGVNMPAKTVCFESLRKFDGKDFRFLNSKEFFQIAGRAGRRGIDNEGFVFAMINRRDFDYERIKRMTESDKEPIVSQFRLSINTILNLIKTHNQREIDEILSKSFHSFQQYGAAFEKKKNHLSHRTFENYKRKLEKMGYLKQGKLTPKGDFASQIYADEIVFTEIFATDFYKDLNEFQVLMLIACICYEGRAEFKVRYPSPLIKILKKNLYAHHYLQGEKRFNFFDDLTALVHPVYHGATLFEIMGNSDLLEGDLIRFFRQMVDRMRQLKAASRDRILVSTLESCELVLSACMKDIDLI